MKKLYIERILKMFNTTKEEIRFAKENKNIVRAKKTIIFGLTYYYGCKVEEIAELLDVDACEVEMYKKEKNYHKDIRNARDIHFIMNKEFKMKECKYLADKGYAFFKYCYAGYLRVVNLYEDVEKEMIKYYLESAHLGRNSAFAILANYYKRNKKLSDVLYTMASLGYEVNKDLIEEIHSGRSLGNEELIYTTNDGEYSMSFLQDVHSPSKYLCYEDGVYDYQKGFSLYSQLGDFLTTELKYPQYLKEISKYERCNILMFPSYDLKYIKVSFNREDVGEKIFILDVDRFTLEEEINDIM